MTGDQEGSSAPKLGEPLEMDFRVAEFPSDVLSVRRFRRLFPQHFDGRDRIADGYTTNNFFFPTAAEKPEHLMRLTELVCDERTVASGAFYREFVGQCPEVLTAQDLECIEDSKRRLEELYQYFRLADSPETARMLIREAEEQGRQQALSDRSKSR